MAKLEDFIGKKEPEIVFNGIPVEGTFTCMDCGEVTQNGFIDYDEKALVWTCIQCDYMNRVGMNV